MLLAALLVGGLVLGARLAQEPVYTVDADLFLVAGDVNGSDQDAEVERLSVFYAQIVNDPRVVADVARRAGRPLTDGELRGHLDVSSPSKGQLTVTVQQPTAVRAVRLASAVGDAMALAATRDQDAARDRDLAPLQTELAAVASGLRSVGGDDAARQALLDRQQRALEARGERLAARPARLDVVRRPTGPGSAVRTPDAARDGVLAFLVTLVLAAEVAALLAARRKGLEGRDPVPALTAWTGLPVLRVGANHNGPDETVAAARMLRGLADGGPVRLAALDPSPAAVEGAEAVQTAVEAGASARAGVGRALGEGSPGRVQVLASWDDPQLFEEAERAPGVCALVVDARLVRQPGLEEAVRVLGYGGAAPAALLVVDGRRRRPSVDRDL
ncbi:MAG: hypothetical protein JWM64_1129 [Frankiales bacterium]|nr:hypothetical protein [Frankiales bacterium]